MFFTRKVASFPRTEQAYDEVAAALASSRNPYPNAHPTAKEGLEREWIKLRDGFVSEFSADPNFNKQRFIAASEGH